MPVEPGMLCRTVRLPVVTAEGRNYFPRSEHCLGVTCTHHEDAIIGMKLPVGERLLSLTLTQLPCCTN